MQLEDYFDFSDPNDIRLKGHRVWIQHVLYPYVNEGKSAEQIAADLPTLSLDKVYATILYYLLNKELVTKYLVTLREQLDAARAAQEADPKFQATRDRLRRVRAEWDARRQGAGREPQVSAG